MGEAGAWRHSGHQGDQKVESPSHPAQNRGWVTLAWWREQPMRALPVATCIDQSDPFYIQKDRTSTARILNFVHVTFDFRSIHQVFWCDHAKVWGFGELDLCIHRVSLWILTKIFRISAKENGEITHLFAAVMWLLELVRRTNSRWRLQVKTPQWDDGRVSCHDSLKQTKKKTVKLKYDRVLVTAVVISGHCRHCLFAFICYRYANFSTSSKCKKFGISEWEFCSISSFSFLNLHKNGSKNMQNHRDPELQRC